MTDDSDSDPVPAQSIEPSAPEEFGLVQVWWGTGKGKTTAALGMGARAAGHGYRVHMLQFRNGGTETVEDVRGEYNAIAALPGVSYENAGHYGWHGFLDGLADDEHEAQVRGALAGRWPTPPPFATTATVGSIVSSARRFWTVLILSAIST